MTQLKMGHMTWQEYKDFTENDAVVFLPVGALEQHGPHLPMATDAIFAEAMAERVAATMNDTYNCTVMPVLSYGYKSQARSGGGQTFPGTTSLDGFTLCSQVKDIIRELARHEIKNLVILDGHYENQWFLTEAIELMLRELTVSGRSMKIVRCEYWDYTPKSVLEEVFDGQFPGYDLEHAALIETSMMLALHPELVRQDKIPEDKIADFSLHDHFPQDGRGVPDSGVLAPASKASAEKGWKLINSCVAAMVAAFVKEFS